MNVFFKKIGGFGHIFVNRKSNVLSIISYVKICADSKKILILTKCTDFCLLWPKNLFQREIMKNNYIYFNKNNSFQDILLKIGRYTL